MWHLVTTSIVLFILILIYVVPCQNIILVIILHIISRPPLNCQKCQFRFFTDQGLERHLLGSHGLVTSSMQDAANKSKDSGRCPVCGRVSNIFIHCIYWRYSSIQHWQMKSVEDTKLQIWAKFSTVFQVLEIY